MLDLIELELLDGALLVLLDGFVLLDDNELVSAKWRGFMNS